MPNISQRCAFEGRLSHGPNHTVTRYKLHCYIAAQRSWAADQHRGKLMFGRR